MAKRKLNYLILTMVLAISSNLQSNQNNSANQNKVDNEKYDILRRDQVDQTDIFEIPLGDSEVEDEEELNRAEKKEVFKLPSAR